MTIVTNTSMTHTGLLVTVPGNDIEIDVELIGGRTLRLSADGTELGAWPVEDCHIEEQSAGDGSFRIVVDGDDAVFTPTDPVSFRALIQRLKGTESLPDPDPATSPDVATESHSGASDDPVAFLFGSSPPPPPPGPVEFGDFDEPAADPADDAASDHVPSVEESAPSLPEAFDVPDDDVVIDGGAIDVPDVDLDFSEEEIDPVMSVSGFDAADDVAVEDAAVDELLESESEPEPVPVVEPEPELVEPVPVEPVSDPVVEPEAVSVEPVPELGAIFVGDADEVAVDVAAAQEDTDAGGGEELRERFGGSALDRLSAAIGSITSNMGGSNASEADEDPYQLGPNTVAEDVLSTQRSLRDHQLKDAVRGKRLKVAGWLVGITAVIALFAFLTPGAIDFIQDYEGGAEPPPPLPVSETTVPAPTTTLVSETDNPEASPVSTVADAGESATIFDRPAPEFVARWDSFAAPVNEVLEFGSNPILGPFEEQFTPYLSLVGVVEPQGTVEEFALVVDPSGPANYDRVGIQALGIAIATVDPERSPEGRAALLGQLGLNVRQPELGGIDGTVESDGVVYTLVYDEATTLLTLTVAPTG